MNIPLIISLAKEDSTFAIIVTASDPTAKLRDVYNHQWASLVSSFKGEKWIEYAINMRADIYKPIEAYSSDPNETQELRQIQAFNNRFNYYRLLLASKNGDSLSSYLNGISIEEFKAALSGLEGNDFARKLQMMYKEGSISQELGGTLLHRFLEGLGFAYIPNVSKLNSARKGDIPTRGNLKRK